MAISKMRYDNACVVDMTNRDFQFLLFVFLARYVCCYSVKYLLWNVWIKVLQS